MLVFPGILLSRLNGKNGIKVTVPYLVSTSVFSPVVKFDDDASVLISTTSVVSPVEILDDNPGFLGATAAGFSVVQLEGEYL